MKRPWAFICASEGATSKHLRNYCREVYLLGYLPVCPKLQDSQYLVLEDAMERSEYTAIVRDKLLRCPMLVVCSRNQDATTNAQIGLAQKYNRILFIRGERPVIDLKYNLLKHPNIRYTEDGGAAPYDYTAADNARDDLPGAPENYELLDMDDFLPAEAAEMKPTIQRIRRST